VSHKEVTPAFLQSSQPCAAIAVVDEPESSDTMNVCCPTVSAAVWAYEQPERRTATGNWTATPLTESESSASSCVQPTAIIKGDIVKNSFRCMTGG
jgi:hypothetical protein